METRPSDVMYICAFSASALVWGAVSPVKLFGLVSVPHVHPRRDPPEHANLALDVPPLARRLQLVRQQAVQPLPHVDDPLCHALHLLLPFSIQHLVAEDRVRNAGAIDRRVGIHRPDDNLELAINASLLACILRRHRECTNAFTVQSHILGEGLGQCNLVSLGDKMTDCKRISGCRPGSEALVGHIKEREKLSFFNNVRNHSPLLLRRVNARRVVCTCMQENNSVLRRSLSTAVPRHESP